MGDSIQKVFQRRGDKKRQNGGVRDLLIPLFLLLPIFSLVTGFIPRYPLAFVVYSLCLFIYLATDWFLFKRIRNMGSISIQGKYELITAILVVIATLIYISPEKWVHLLYLPVVVFIGIRLDTKLNIFTVLLIIIMEIRHILSFDIFELSINSVVIVVTILSLLLTRDLKEKKNIAESTLSRIKDKAEMYDMASFEEEDIIAHTLKQTDSYDEELSEIAFAIKESLYTDGVHLFVIPSSPTDKPLVVRYSTDKAPAVYRTGIVQRVAQEGIPRLITFDSKRLTPGYACHYEINTVLAVPVKEGSAVSGVLAIDSMRMHAFNDRDMEIMERYARVISSIMVRQRMSLYRDRAEKSIRLLHKITAQLTTTIRPEELISRVIESYQSLFPSSIVNFIVRNGDRFEVFKNGLYNGSDILQMKPNFMVSNPFYSLISEEKKFLYIPHVRAEDFSYLPFYVKNATSLLVLPLWYEHELLGLIVLSSSSFNAYKHEQIEVLRVYANQVAVAFQNAKLYKEIENMATTDGLTGLFNHRKFQEELDKELKRHERSGRPLCLALCDIDFFKKINDTYGHPAGDAVLKSVAGIIKETVRSTDIPARYGGEEFAIILIETPLKEAKTIAERIRKKVESHKFSYKGTIIRATLSTGIATFIHTQKITKGKLIERADKALYHAKHNGRNQIVLWEEMTE
jgi:diguanylate cyclase (GGDEF)-like protein